MNIKDNWKYFTDYVLGEDTATALLGIILASLFVTVFFSVAIFISGFIPEETEPIQAKSSQEISPSPRPWNEPQTWSRANYPAPRSF